MLLGWGVLLGAGMVIAAFLPIIDMALAFLAHDLDAGMLLTVLLLVLRRLLLSVTVLPVHAMSILCWLVGLDRLWGARVLFNAVVLLRIDAGLGGRGLGAGWLLGVLLLLLLVDLLTWRAASRWA